MRTCNVCCWWWKWEIGFRVFGTISYTFEMCKGSDFQRRVLHYSSSFRLRCLLVHQSHSPKVRNACLSLCLLLRLILVIHCWSKLNSMGHALSVIGWNVLNCLTKFGSGFGPINLWLQEVAIYKTRSFIWVKKKLHSWENLIKQNLKFQKFGRTLRLDFVAFGLIYVLEFLLWNVK